MFQQHNSLKIVITSYGTLGDNLPLIELAQTLKIRGHQVKMAISDSMYPYAIKAGLEVTSNGRSSLGKSEAQEHSAAWNHLTEAQKLTDEEVCDAFHWHLMHGFPDLLDACQAADLLITTPQQTAIAVLVQEKLNLPWILASVTPSLHCQTHKPPQDNPLSDRIDAVIQAVRQSIGLSELSHQDWKTYGQCDRFMLGSSPHFSQSTVECSNSIQTGFWFYEDPEWSDWQPDRDLQAFMEHQPLVLSFSSQPLQNARSVVEVHVRAAAKLGLKLLIQQGWADFNEDYLPAECDRSQVRFVGFIPQDWLFSHAAALIHHGGIGTTARSLRNACPMLVEPYGNDQFFNARQIILLGVGAAMHPMYLSVEQLVRVLQEKILTSECRNRTAELAAKIRQEQGVELASEWIEQQLYATVLC
jgi:UDP:flavonoid glycosyltransferase YjiC (YdhE family)